MVRKARNAKGLARIKGRLAVMLSRCPKPIATKAAYDRLADELQLDRVALARRYAGGDNEFEVLVRTAYKQLKQEDFAPKATLLNRGQWSPTEAGHAYAIRIESIENGALSLEDIGL